MRNSVTKAALLGALVLLGGCHFYSLNREAGDMDPGDFGNATMQNTMLANGQIQPQMSNDKYDPPSGGRLNGKYAAKIWQGYVAGDSGQTAATASATSGASAGNTGTSANGSAASGAAASGTSQ